jgi:hypothetical protein
MIDFVGTLWDNPPTDDYYRQPEPIFHIPLIALSKYLLKRASAGELNA